MASASIDFSLAPDLSWGHLILGLPPDLESALSALPETTDRALGAYLFSGDMGNRESSIKDRECFLRAALAEFVSMEDALPRDLARTGISAKPIKIRECPEPELHMIHHLRNLELHLQTSSLGSSSITAVAGSHSFQKDLWFVQELKVVDVEGLRNVQIDLRKGRYTPADIDRLVTWFNHGQRQVGVSEIIMRAVIAFTKRIISTYSLHPPVV